MPDVPEPLSKFPIRNGLLQGPLDCAGHTLFNVDLTGLGLTKASVGLGNVDNTSDLNKPISNATQAALNLKENLITAGTTSQFWRGDKTWQNFGSFILQNNQTTYSFISVRGDDASGSSSFRAERNDGPGIHTRIGHYGASVAGTIAGLPAANIGQLAFVGASYGLILTDGAPIVFAPNNTRRMRLGMGLNVGGDSDPGAGCISAFGTITGTTIIGGFIDATAGFGNIVAPHITIQGGGGNGWIAFPPQTVDPPGGLGAMLFADAGGFIAITSSLNSTNKLSFNTTSLTADRAWTILDVVGSIPVRVTAIPGTSAAAGVSGSIAFDGSFLYVCTTTGTPGNWRRVAVAAF